MNTAEKIELYVSGKMNQTQLSEMEQLMSSDKALAGEVDLQSAIIESIKTNRKLALKSSLNAIPASAITEFGNQVARATYMKIAAMVVGAIFTIGVGAYFLNKKESESTKTTLKVEDSKNQTFTSSKNVKIASNKVSETVETKVENVGKNESINKELIATENKVNAQNSGSKQLISKVKSKTEENNRAFLDNKFEGESETVIKSDVKESKELIAAEPTSKASEVDITSIKDGKHKFHYSKKENLLCLYGNFDDSPYEILELNDINGQAIYLFYKNSYYSLKNTNNGGVERLKKINDEKTLEALAKVRKH